jgi:hypothetical protein
MKSVRFGNFRLLVLTYDSVIVPYNTRQIYRTSAAMLSTVGILVLYQVATLQSSIMVYDIMF